MKEKKRNIIMPNIAALLFSVVVVLVTTGKSEGKEIDKEKITYFLQKYEITEIVEVPGRSSVPLTVGVQERVKSFQITAFGNIITVDLSMFYPREDTQIDYISKLSNNTGSFLYNPSMLYQGYVRNVENSFALGMFSQDKSFRGYLITDEIFCIEPYKSGSVIVYTFKDVIIPGCSKKSENEGLDCSQTRYFEPWAAHREPPERRFYSSYNLFYDAYLNFLQQLQAIKDKAKTDDEQKNPSTDKHNDSEREHYHKSEKKYKNKNDVEQNSESYSAEGENDFHEEPDSGGKTKKPKTTKTVDSTENKKYKSKKYKPKPEKEKLEEDYDDDDDDDFYEEPDSGGKTKKPDTTIGSREKRKHMKHKSEKHKPKPKEEVEEDDDDDDDDEDNDNKFFKDDDRFAVFKSNVAFQKHSIDAIQNLSKTSRLNANDSRNMNNTHNKMDSSGMGKESVEVKENYQKQIVKREKESGMESIMEALESDSVEALQCNVQVVVAPSLLKRFDDDFHMTVKDVYIQLGLLNKIFLKLPLKSKGKTVHLTFHATNLVIYGDEVYSPFPGNRANLESYTKSTRNYDSLKEICLSIGVVNQYLRSGDFFDGYTPDAKGGACSKNGNTLLVSHGNENNPAPMAIYFAALMRGVTRAVGALDKDADCEEGSLPNPMEVLQGYLLTKEIVPSSGYSIFSSCNVKEIEKTLNLRACFYRVSQPLCGNSILDPGEECDCGPIAVCSEIDPCCHTPNMYLDPKPSEVKRGSVHKSCTLAEGSKCSKLQPCCSNCKIEKDKSVCYSGPSECDIAMCDGKSASCPTGVEASNAMLCHTNETLREPMICKDGECNQPLCSSFELEPCTCTPGSDKDCLYCCMKDGKCQAAGTELKLFPNRNYSLPDGTDCMGGSCLLGKCFIYDVEGARMRMRVRETLDKPPKISASSEERNEFSPLFTILDSVFSVLVLFLLQN